MKILSSLAWAPESCATFLSQWNAKSPKLPQSTSALTRYERQIAELVEVEGRADRAHPLGKFLAKTAGSFADAARMLEAIGTPAYTELAKSIYGTPLTPLGSSDISILTFAEEIIEKTKGFIPACAVSAADYCVMPDFVAEELRRVVVPFFKNHPVEIVIDPNLTAKAAAGARRIRIRGGTCFLPMDIPELIHHEAFVHTLTMINGREQPVLKSLGLSSPRTVCTQEGLAVFAEFFTHSIDLSRLRRIALRVKAVQLGLDGADFIEVFKFFLDAGQDEQESFHSTMRIFRGGDTKGGIVSTKDCVYLQGLVMIHSFLLHAIEAGNLMYPHYLFAGRVAVSDIADLEEFFKDGTIAAPYYIPDWVKDRPCLTAFLLHSAFMSRVRLIDEEPKIGKNP